MKTKNKYLIIVLVSLPLLGWVLPASYKTFQSVCCWNTFRIALQKKDSEQIHRLLFDASHDLHEIGEHGQVFYFGQDISGKLVTEQVSIVRTMEYYLADPQRKRKWKIVLQHGYATVEDGHITFLKFP